MSERSRIPRLEQRLIYIMYCIYAAFNFLEFSYDWNMGHFTPVSKVRSILRYTTFTVLWLVTLVYTFCLSSSTLEMMFLFIYVGHPLFAFCRQSMNKQRIIARMNRLQKCVRRTQRMSRAAICLSKPIYGLFLVRVLFVLAIFREISNEMPKEQRTLTCFFFLIPYTNMYIYTHGICIQLSYLEVQLLRLNDNLDEDLNLVVLHKVLASNVKEIASLYRSSSRLLLDFAKAHTFDSIVIVFQVMFASVSGQQFFAKINSVHFFDVLVTWHLYAAIRSELKRSQTLAETFEVKQDPELMHDLVIIHVAAVIGELCADKHFTRFHRAVACAVPAVLLNFAVIGCGEFL